VIIARKDIPANTLKEFVDYVRQNQSKVNEAHAGVGSQMHTFCTYLHALMGTKTARIAYRGGGPAVTDLMTGQVGAAVPAKANRTPQALQALVGSEVARWSSVLKGAEAGAN
jgi:tripartite-type tricarboxylate transporter receptor subunit TctC